jgi:anti-sigma-K factor RskA
MECPSQNSSDSEAILEYCAGKFTAEAVLEFERHVSLCASCNQKVSQQRRMWAALDIWEAPAVSEDFDRKLYARIEESEVQSWWTRCIAGRKAWRPALSVGAVCAAIVLAVAFYTPADQPRVSPAPLETTRVESVEPEQVERALEDIDMLDQLSPNGSHSL